MTNVVPLFILKRSCRYYSFRHFVELLEMMRISLGAVYNTLLNIN